jgi:hypothetical protein
MMKSRNAPLFGAFLAAGLASALLASCDIQPQAVIIPYSSKVVDFHPYLDKNGDGDTTDNDDGPAAAPDFTLVYDATGKLSGKFAMSYGADGLLERTDCYQYDADGLNPVLVSYDVFTYEAVTYYGAGVSKRHLIRAETFVPSGSANVSRLYYTIAYAHPDLPAVVTDHYSSIDDFKWDDVKQAFEQTNRQTASWVSLDGDALYDHDAGFSPTHYRTKQEYQYDADGANPKLTTEYAAYYNASGVMVNELYHVIRSPYSTVDILPSGKDEGYYYVQYSRNPQGRTCFKANNWYGDPSNSPSFLPRLPPPPPPPPPALPPPRPPFPAFVHPFSYAIEPLFIGDNADMILTDFDDAGNPVKESYYAYGSLKEIKTYRWLDASRMAEATRYISGGATLEERETYRYYDIGISGARYSATEKTIYYMDEAADGAVDGAASSRSALSQTVPVGPGPAAFLASFAEAKFKSMRNAYEQR